jgi:sugar phosphate isomerase/epimerase
VRSVNGDVGDFNLPEVDRAARDLHLERLLALTARIDADALVLPCGALSHEPIVSLGADLDLVASELLRAARLAEEHGVAIWVESLHYLRLCFDRERADALHARLAGSGIRPVLDVAHVVAAGDDVPALVAGWGEAIAHVHLRDAIAGDFNRPFGTGEVDFAEAVRALDAIGFDGAYALELPSAAYDDDATGAIDDEARLAKKNLVAAAAELMTPLLDAGPAIEGATP